MALEFRSKFENYIHFAIIVDNEVASYISVPPEDEKHKAIFLSNPVFVQVPYDQKPVPGSFWDGEKFIPVEGLE